MLRAVQKTIRKHHMLQVGETVIVAVSGGADSTALLDILYNLKELRLKLVAAHLNHSLRGEESDGDELFVRELAERYGIPFVVEKADVKLLSRERRLSLEDAGRKARYAFFERAAAELGADVVALAHHADDQAETVLMRLLRGAGGSGLTGIPPKSGRYVRPLIDVTRSDIERYLAGRGVTFRQDSTNTDINFLRNRIRHELVPYLAAYNPSITERLIATSRTLAADEELLESLTGEAFARSGSLAGDRAAFNVDRLRQEPLSLRMRLFRRAILLVKGNLEAIGQRHLQDADHLLFSAKPNLTVALPGELSVSRAYGSLIFAHGGENVDFIPYEACIDGPGSYPLPGGGVLSLEAASAPENWKDTPPNMAFIDRDAAPFPWVVRTFRPGDRLKPFGMGGAQKVKDLFINEKIPLELRRRMPLLFSGQTLLWVCGMRRSADAQVAAGKRSVVRVVLSDFTP